MPNNVGHDMLKNNEIIKTGHWLFVYKKKKYSSHNSYLMSLIFEIYEVNDKN